MQARSVIEAMIEAGRSPQENLEEVAVSFWNSDVLTFRGNQGFGYRLGLNAPGLRGSSEPDLEIFGSNSGTSSIIW